jgi:dihydroorotate dehydrogenase
MIAPGVSLNRLGFNSPGMEAVAGNLERYRTTERKIGIVGISIGKNKDIPLEQAPNAHFLVAQRLYDYADYFAINVSSPNTPGLRSLQEKGPLTDIVHATIAAIEERGERKPLFIKIAPDNLTPDATNDIIRVVIDNRLSGIIATNTTVNSELKANYGEQWRSEMGGLAGDDPDFRRMSTEMVRHVYRETNGGVDIIGVGGVNDTASALEKIQAGAKVVQIVTGIRGSLPLHRAVFEQGKLPGRINRGIVDWMDQEGVSNISEIVGQNAA